MAIFLKTYEIPWEPDPDIPGFKRRMLHKNKKTGAQIKLWYLPPAFGAAVGELPHRHYHQTVTERAYHLSGDFPHWDFNSPSDMDGELIIFKRHIFMDRPPMSIHGRFPEPSSVTGSEILYWNTGVGTGLGEPEADTETVTVEFEPIQEDKNKDFMQARIFSTIDRPWHLHPIIGSWKQKKLANKAKGTHSVLIINIPPESSGYLNARIQGKQSPLWMFMITGDLKLNLAEQDASSQIYLKEGDFVALENGVSAGFSDGIISQGGATVLCVGHNLIENIV